MYLEEVHFVARAERERRGDLREGRSGKQAEVFKFWVATAISVNSNTLGQVPVQSDKTGGGEK
jgi:hypothetical protein